VGICSGRLLYSIAVAATGIKASMQIRIKSFLLVILRVSFQGRHPAHQFIQNGHV
jgi:hypothetical protein